jgi:hypothetical protein
MVTISPKPDSFPPTSTDHSSKQGECEETSCAVECIRMEWNGLVGCRVLRITHHTDDGAEASDSRLDISDDEELIGEICEPFS